MLNKKIIILATNNLHKFKEIKCIFSLFNCEFKLKKLEKKYNFDKVEKYNTYKQNALAKAIFLRKFYRNYYILADDSGLEVKSLNGFPGIKSSRAFGKNLTDKEKIKFLLKKLKKKKNLKARFVCCMCLITPEDKIIFAYGWIYGKILKKMQGKNGFGYDPVFGVKKLNYKSMALLEDIKKNQISHRYNAVKNLLKKIRFLK